MSGLPPTRRMRSAMTLVEVLASLAIIGILLAGVTRVRGQAVRQWVEAQRMLAAVEVADGLLAQWHRHGSPGEAEGEAGGYVWVARDVAEHPAAALGLRVTRLELFTGDRLADEPIVQVDTVWPQPVADRAADEAAEPGEPGEAGDE